MHETTTVTCRAAHMRIDTIKGKASNRTCGLCDKQAKHWAYTHTATQPLTDAQDGRPYSLDPNHYVALCSSCHKLYDLHQAGRTPHIPTPRKATP